jgi:hypothetical protein
MGNAILEVVPQAMQQLEKGLGAPRQNQGTRSFQSVLQEGGASGKTAQEDSPAGKSQGGKHVSGAGLEQLRSDLARRLGQIPSENKSLDSMMRELTRTGTRMSMLREAMTGVDNSPTGTNLKGLFGRVEGEWFNLEQFMKSDKDLSTGELLGLQARLYQVSQHIDVMSKVVDQMTGGIKTILNTNV